MLIVASKAIKTIMFVYKNILRKRRDLLARYGDASWVFITGSSDGIGRAFAHAFAKRGFNIVLSARTESKLLKVQE
jgi:17beta-estradiol 17-dehydrogenase / very-long-chain 3-oxoacyl-CoA reductase